MVRPHPALWRLIHGVVVVYLLFCIFLLFQNVTEARQFLRVGTPTAQDLTFLWMMCSFSDGATKRLQKRLLEPQTMWVHGKS